MLVETRVEIVETEMGTERERTSGREGAGRRRSNRQRHLKLEDQRPEGPFYPFTDLCLVLFVTHSAL